MSDSLPEQVLDRRVAVTSVPNTRDLGGLPVDGGVFASGQVFRSSALGAVSEADARVLIDLGVSTVYDLRTEAERATEPDSLPGPARLVHLDVLADANLSVAALIGKLRNDTGALNELLGDGSIQQMLTESYRDFIRLPSAITAYREFFLGLADARREGAALFHCTAGKDRTGWAAASLLTLLGADEQTVRADYLQTNDDLLPAFAPLFESAAAKGVDPGLLQGVFGVQVSYLDAALEEIETHYGAVENYFADGLGLRGETIDALRERFVR